MPPAIKDRISSFRRWQDAHALLLGRCLLQQAMADQHSSYGQEQVRYTAAGKPFVEGFMDFNLSHSGTLVACALSDKGPVGIDIEAIKPLSFDFLRDSLPPEEWDSIKASNFPANTFYPYWTRKEAVLKADGSGISMHTTLNFTDRYRVQLKEQSWYLQQLSCFDHYSSHIASAADEKIYCLKEWSPSF